MRKRLSKNVLASSVYPKHVFEELTPIWDAAVRVASNDAKAIKKELTALDVNREYKAFLGTYLRVANMRFVK